MLTVTKSTVTAILRWASEHPEVEVCGLVWASERPGAFRQTVHPLPNIHPKPQNYYRTAPKDVREAFELMDEQGGEPLAWYHSHPSGKPDPSVEDMLGAMNTGMHYLIAYPDKELAAKMRGDLFREGPPWRISAWECISTGVLVEAEYEVQG